MTDVNIKLSAAESDGSIETDWDRWFYVFSAGYSENQDLSIMHVGRWPSSAQKRWDFIAWYPGHERCTGRACRAAGRRAYAAWARNNRDAFYDGYAPSVVPFSWVWVVALLIVAAFVARG